MDNNVMQLIDVSKIYNGETTQIDFEFEIQPEDTDILDLAFHNPVKVTGKVYEKARGKDRAESYVELVFSVTGEYDTHCARCAKPITEKFEYNRVYGVAKKLVGDSDDYVEAPKGILDVGELARSYFYLELPGRVLCKEDCKGLCPVCGTDLNEGTCTCKKNIDANTLSDLKKLLDKD